MLNTLIFFTTLNCKLKMTHVPILYTRYPIVARRAWPTGCIGRVRRASKGILHTSSNKAMSFILILTLNVYAIFIIVPFKYNLNNRLQIMK